MCIHLYSKFFYVYPFIFNLSTCIHVYPTLLRVSIYKKRYFWKQKEISKKFFYQKKIRKGLVITESVSIISLLAWLVGPLTRWVAQRQQAAEAEVAARVAADLEQEAGGHSPAGPSSSPPSYSTLVIEKQRFSTPPPPQYTPIPK